MFAKSSLLFLFVAVAPCIYGHVIHMGGDCAAVQPMPKFDMDKFVGKWYVIEKTSTSSRCMTYDFQKTEFRKKYKVQQISENSVIGLVKDNYYKYTGELELKDEDNQADMTVKFPLNIAGKSSFIVFMTDYEEYAGTYSCQTIGFTHRESAAILSRKPILSAPYIEKIRNRLASFNVNPFEMTHVNHTNCPDSERSYTIDINETTFSKENIKNALKKAGSAIGDGVDFIVKGAKKVYTSVKNDDQGHKNVQKDREELSDETFQPGGFEPNAELL